MIVDIWYLHICSIGWVAQIIIQPNLDETTPISIWGMPLQLLFHGKTYDPTLLCIFLLGNTVSCSMMILSLFIEVWLGKYWRNHQDLKNPNIKPVGYLSRQPWLVCKQIARFKMRPVNPSPYQIIWTQHHSRLRSRTRFCLRLAVAGTKLL